MLNELTLIFHDVSYFQTCYNEREFQEIFPLYIVLQLHFYNNNITHNTAQKMKLSIKDFSRKCDQIRRKLRIWSHLLETSLLFFHVFQGHLP